MIKVKLKEGCTTYGIYTDSTLSFREILMQFIHTADDQQIENLLEYVISANGDWEDLGYCEQCNDSFGEYVLEIKDVND